MVLLYRVDGASWSITLNTCPVDSIILLPFSPIPLLRPLVAFRSPCAIRPFCEYLALVPWVKAVSDARLRDCKPSNKRALQVGNASNERVDATQQASIRRPSSEATALAAITPSSLPAHANYCARGTNSHKRYKIARGARAPPPPPRRTRHPGRRLRQSLPRSRRPAGLPPRPCKPRTVQGGTAPAAP